MYEILTMTVRNQTIMHKVDKLRHKKAAYYLVIWRLEIKPKCVKGGELGGREKENKGLLFSLSPSILFSIN